MLKPCVNEDLISLLLLLCQLAPLVFPRTGVIQPCVIQPCVISLYASQTRRHTPHLIEGLMMTFISEEVAGGPSLSKFFLGSLLACSQGCPTYHISLPYESTQSERYCCFRCSFEKVLWKAALKLWSPPTYTHRPLFSTLCSPTQLCLQYFFIFLLSWIPLSYCGRLA